MMRIRFRQCEIVPPIILCCCRCGKPTAHPKLDASSPTTTIHHEQLDIFARNKHEKVVVLRPCKHTFHRQCIKQWFIAEMRRGKPILSCPLCRTEIVPKQSVVIKYSSKVYNAVFRRGKRTSSDPETPSDVVNALLF
eukprot:m.169963 g.169963  ORF g.169963 m.169963 type:complete len:137 (+) comp24183_c1_seq2:991-1401(+)